MRANEFIVERKKRKRKPRWAAYGPGPYGGYGYATGYSGDGGASVGGAVGEGWKDTLAGAALATGLAFGAPGDADAKQQPLGKPSVTQQVSKKELSKTVTGNPHEVVLKKAAERAGITGQELVAFLSQAAHETLDFKHMKEIGGSLDFRKYDPKYAPKKAKALGNTKPGDGAKYKGRGYIQLTGKYNYNRAGEALGLDLVNKPELVEKPEVAAKVAVWYWQNRVANKVDNFKDTKAVTKKINPGLKHLDQRKEKQQAFQVAMK
jgi:putative chitinase